MIAESIRKRSKRLFWWLGGLVSVYAFLGFVLIPFIAQDQLTAFSKARLGLDASVSKISLNPFTFTANIANLDLLETSGERVLALDSVTVNLQITQLISGIVSLAELTLDGLYIGVHRDANGNINLARIAERFSASAAPASTQTSTDDEASALAVDIAQLRIVGASIGLTDEVPVVPFITLVESIDITLQGLSTVPQSKAEQSFVLALGDGSQLSWRGDLSIVPVSSSGQLQLTGPISDLAYRYLQAQIPVQLEGGWFDSRLNYELGLSDDGVFDLHVSDLQASLRNLDILTLGQGERLAFLPSIAISGGQVNLQDKRVQLARIELGDFHILPRRLADGSINFLSLLAEEAQEELLVSADSASAAQDEPWDIEIVELLLERWQISARDEVPILGVDVTLDVNASANNISNRANSPINIESDISLQSGGLLRAGGQLTVLPALSFDGEFALEEFELPVLQAYIEDVANIGLESGRLALAGNVRATASQSEINGAFSLNDLAISDRIQNEALFGITALQIDSAAISIGERNNVEIGTVRIRQPYARFEIEADGSTNIGRVLVGSEAEATPTVASEPALEETMAVLLESIEIEGASADFSDSSLPLPFAVHMDALGGSVSGLSTRSREPARVALEGQVDDYGQVTISGRLRPLDYASLTEIDLFFRNLDIPSLSPYVIKFAGRTIAEGDLDVDLSYRINEGQLDGANSMVMRDLVLGERVAHPDALDLPLGLAIALLKDRNGVIDLDVPVTGELNNPQFSFGSVISRALSNIISNIVSSPFRFLANLVGGADDEDIGTIEFVPGRADLTPPEREKLAKLSAALLERPQLELGLTPIYVVGADRAALQANFFESRLDLAIETAALQPEAPGSPSALRMQVLEGLYQASAQDPAQLVAAQAFLADLQQQHTPQSNAQQAQIDILAYNEALRRLLIEREVVTDADLTELGGERVDAIAGELARIDAQLTQRLGREEQVQAVQLQEGRVPMALSLSTLAN